MTLTGTCVLAYVHASDALDALASAVGLSTAALGLLLRYLTRPPKPGAARADIAAAYGLTLGQLRSLNTELTEAGYLLQARRPAGSSWQHLIVVTDTPGTLPATAQAWLLLDAALAAEQATQRPFSDGISPDSAHAATCDDADQPQAATCDQKPHIEPVNPFPSDLPDPAARPAVVATVAELRELAKLPPLPAPDGKAWPWLSPSQVLWLLGRFPARYGELALAVLARQQLPWYLAPSVVAAIELGYDTGQIGRTLAGCTLADHPAAVARWRLDQLLLAEPPNHVAWRPPSTHVPDPAPPADLDTPHLAAELAAARAAMAAAGTRLRQGARA